MSKSLIIDNYLTGIRISPLALCFHTQMSSNLFEGDFELPALHEVLQDLNWGQQQGNRKVQTHFAFDQSSEWHGGESTPLIGIRRS